ncbi:uncharacterized protein [Branchiostoma lanceolatum]|uniref:uncharacterized protein isoform X1 n=2 Tax=Branchiostoma lanceolatum TaxID=7740 RepID=UPI003455E81F
MSVLGVEEILITREFVEKLKGRGKMAAAGLTDSDTDGEFIEPCEFCGSYERKLKKLFLALNEKLQNDNEALRKEQQDLDLQVKTLKRDLKKATEEKETALAETDIYRQSIEQLNKKFDEVERKCYEAMREKKDIKHKLVDVTKDKDTYVLKEYETSKKFREFQEKSKGDLETLQKAVKKEQMRFDRETKALNEMIQDMDRTIRKLERGPNKETRDTQTELPEIAVIFEGEIKKLEKIIKHKDNTIDSKQREIHSKERELHSKVRRMELLEKKADEAAGEKIHMQMDLNKVRVKLAYYEAECRRVKKENGKLKALQQKEQQQQHTAHAHRQGVPQSARPANSNAINGLAIKEAI